MSRKKHTHTQKKEPKPWCPQPNCAAVVEESSTAACSYIGGRSLAVSAADLLGWGNSLVASTQNTLDSQKLSDGKINLGLKIDKSKQPFETAKWREFQLWFCLFTAESPNKNMLQNSKCSIAKSNLQSQIWMVCAIDSLFLLKFRDGFFWSWTSCISSLVLPHCRNPHAAWQGKTHQLYIKKNNENILKPPYPPFYKDFHGFSIGTMVYRQNLQQHFLLRRKRSKRPCSCSNLSSDAWEWVTTLASPSISLLGITFSKRGQRWKPHLDPHPHDRNC